MKFYALTCFGRSLNKQILTKSYSTSPEGVSSFHFAFSEAVDVIPKELEVAFFTDKEIELILSRDSQDHVLIKNIPQAHWQRHILDHHECIDITPVAVDLDI